jgi:S1-C subfamily serine protease
LLALAGCGGLPDAAVPALSPTVGPTASPSLSVATPTPLSEADLAPIDIEERLVTNLYERVGPSVVHITAQIVTMDFFFGPMASEGTGSGFVWDELGHIVTNYHVVEGAETVVVIFSDETQVPAAVVGVDPRNDLAVLRVDPAAADLHPIALGSSADLRVGQRAIAIGNPFGLDRTLTTGVISALGRPLLNSRGEVIGVNTAVRQDAQGIGFAIPVDTVQRVVPILIRDCRYEHPTLGLLGYTITPVLAEALDLPVERGVLVDQLRRGGPADRVGVRGAQREVIIGNRRVLAGGDIITEIDGEPIGGWDALAEYLSPRTKVGDEVTLGLNRDGEPVAVRLRLAAEP